MQRRYRKRPPKRSEIKRFRMNLLIKASPVRFVDEEKGISEIIPLNKALKRAQELELDLVEVSPKADPPVVKALDFGQFKYAQEKKAKKQKSQHKKTEVKGIRLTFRIKGNDLETKRQQALKFLEAGNNVKAEMQLRGRERAHRDKAIALIEQFVANLGEKVTKLRPIDRQGGRLSVEITKK